MQQPNNAFLIDNHSIGNHSLYYSTIVFSNVKKIKSHNI